MKTIIQIKTKIQMKTIKNNFSKYALLVAILFAITACKKEDDTSPTSSGTTTTTSSDISVIAGPTAADDAQLAFIEVGEGATITFGEGTFTFITPLSMDGKSKVTIIGAGQGKTILDFSGQNAGGEAVLISNSASIRIEGITIRDAKGDALKTTSCDKISFVNVGTIWSGEPSETNGAYGLYPVLCTEVYIDSCYAYGASDAGIYVGQSDMIIVKNSVVEGNVAGIEIENSTNADVFNNEAFDNTGGILIFDLPSLTKAGRYCRVFDNNCHDNNRENFAPDGNIVGNVPAGTGCFVLSSTDVQVYNNEFHRNHYGGIMVLSYFIVGTPTDPTFNPYCSGIYIHGNSITVNGDSINRTNMSFNNFGIMSQISTAGYDQPDITVDGVVDSADVDPICINQPSASFLNLNLDVSENVDSIISNKDDFYCTKLAFPAIVFEEY